MKAAPLIIISPSTMKQGVEFYDYSVNLSDAYPRAVAMAGGIPWIISGTPTLEMIAESVRRCDGVCLSGGDDIRPELYRPDITPELRKTVTDIDPQRDLVETMLIEEVFRQRKPLMAICRGQQMLNVAFGGKLIVDLPTERPSDIRHSRLDLKGSIVHEITISEDSAMRGIVGRTTMGVNSSHHQAVMEPAKPFQVVARSSDGVIEAMELKPEERGMLPWLLAVQFHPERLVDGHLEHRRLFQAFTAACVLAREGKL